MLILGVFIRWVTELTVTLRFGSGTEAHRGHDSCDVRHIHRVVFHPYILNECGVIQIVSDLKGMLSQ